MNHLKYSDIVRINKELEDNINKSYNISLLSNVIVHQAKDIIEYQFRHDGVNANVTLGVFDNIIQESQKQKKMDATIIFWEIANLVEGLQYKLELLTEKEIDAIESKMKSEVAFVIKNLENCPLLIINRFTSFFFSAFSTENNKLDNLSIRLNKLLESFSQSNIKLINLDKIIANIGISNSFDPRYYYSSKAPYTVGFFRLYSQFIKPFIMSANGRAKKSIIFDCDNTLWGGVLGEEGIDGIEISSDTSNGVVYREIQSIALSLSQQGVILGLCSKNNPEDVDDVLNNNPNMILHDKDIAIKKVNWLDKATNIKSISKELNIGLDSIVFVDDSLFEVNLVKEHLPDVIVLHVPMKLYEYPQMLRNNLGLFYDLSDTEEDTKKTKMYRIQAQREKIKSDFSTLDGYLASLKMCIVIYKNNESLVPRKSQITQKTNQFNLATRRYTENEIRSMVLSSDYDIYSFLVKDRFGDSGITGLCIINKENNTAVIDSFLMSCRVIGRNIEYVFVDYLVNSLANQGFKNIKSLYKNTKKNKLVENFYDNCSFDLVNSDGPVKNYSLTLSKYRQSGIKYIEIKAGELL